MKWREIRLLSYSNISIVIYKISQVMQSLIHFHCSVQLKKGTRFRNAIWSLWVYEEVGLIFLCNGSSLTWWLLKLLIRKQHQDNVKSANLATLKSLTLFYFFLVVLILNYNKIMSIVKSANLATLNFWTFVASS